MFRLSPFDVGTGRDRRRISAVFLSDQKEGREQYLHSKNACLSCLPISKAFHTDTKLQLEFSLLSSTRPSRQSCGPWIVQMNRIFLDMTCLLLRPSCHPHSSPTSRVGQNPPPPKCHSIPALLLAATKPNVYSSCSLSCYYTEGVDNHLCSQIMIARCQRREAPHVTFPGRISFCFLVDLFDPLATTDRRTRVKCNHDETHRLPLSLHSSLV